MKRLLVILIAVAILSTLSACGKRDAEYFTNHPEKMKQKIEECKKMSRIEKDADRECTAAIDAYSKIFSGDKIEKPGSGKGKELPKF